MTMEQAKKARYHRQVDAGENSHPAKYLKYIAGHDRAKKIMEQDYHLLPQRSNKEKMYYTQARKREARKVPDGFGTCLRSWKHNRKAFKNCRFVDK